MDDGFAKRASTAQVLAALDTVAAALDELRREWSGHEPLEKALDRLAHTAVSALPDADAVSVTQLDGGGPHTTALTDESIAAIDSRQYAAGRGPCLQAARTRSPVRAVVGEHAAQWPEFTAAARAAGIRAYLSVPLLLEGDDPGELVGSLNLYSSRGEAFDPFDEHLMRLLTAGAAAAIGNAQRWQRANERVEQLQTALTSRAEIDQAKGVLMALHGLSGEAAFHRLVDLSQHTNTKLYDVARQLIESVSRPERHP
ncbi:GAF and ANTAR domain-containing protein [Rhodococcus sp. 14C212]|uniref:ANTAR domain-containing protein n=1 Tax=Rhodococcus sp. 14C212 TaxID=2711209 RepID=UPI0013ECDAD0|nr:GAF and ANTAR domain-containing protein [Rhodococcus sp. 14C212]NGP08246.1 GAF and ANTAR domain-containing protein [Rhodococcus sp. 14C212]